MLSLPLILIKHHRIFRLSAAVFSGWSCVKILRYLMRTDFHVAAEYNALFYKCPLGGHTAPHRAYSYPEILVGL